MVTQQISPISEAEPKPRALRIEATDLRDAGRDAEALIADLAAAAIARRRA